MNNPRMTAKERNLLKGAIRRVFARSELRRKVVDITVAKGYIDTTRPRVKTWCKCMNCGVMTPKSYMVVDHVSPIVGLSETLEDLEWTDVVDRTWCDENNLMAICDEPCHSNKTKVENKERRRLKDSKRGKLNE